VILVTGSSGFIGSHVADRMIADGTPGVLARRRPGAPDGLAGSFCVVAQVDLHGQNAFTEVLRTHRVDTVLHLATGGWRSTLAEIVESGVLALARVIEACRAAGTARLVVGSSVAVFGDAGAGPFAEVPAPTGAVTRNGPGLYKRWEEQLATALTSTDLAVQVVRMPMVYGPRYESMINLPARLCRAVATGIDLRVPVPPAFADFAHVHDIARGLVQLCTSSASGPIYHVATGRAVSRADVVAAAEGIGADASVLAVIADLPEWDPSRHLSIDAATRDFGYRPEHDLASGVQSYHRHLAAQITEGAQA
jgi:nucleoside-diphosphate-sugar epimerase